MDDIKYLQGIYVLMVVRCAFWGPLLGIPPMVHGLPSTNPSGGGDGGKGEGGTTGEGGWGPGTPHEPRTWARREAPSAPEGNGKLGT